LVPFCFHTFVGESFFSHSNIKGKKEGETLLIYLCIHHMLSFICNCIDNTESFKLSEKIMKLGMSGSLGPDTYADLSATPVQPYVTTTNMLVLDLDKRCRSCLFGEF
jgi:hypothetical protein